MLHVYRLCEVALLGHAPDQELTVRVELGMAPSG
jgi:hypothetical protein